jgi:hypothetical protein
MNKKCFSILTWILLGMSVHSFSQTSEAQMISESQSDSTGLPGDDFSLDGALELFQKATSVEQWEQWLNDQNQHVNNLDLNQDGEVDYIKVTDQSLGNDHALVLQVPISESESQDIAVIELSKVNSDSAVIQIIGDEDLYGEEMVIEHPLNMSRNLKSSKVRLWNHIESTSDALMFGCGLVCSSSIALCINLGFPLTIGIIILRIGNHGKDITGIAIGGIAINSIIMEGIFGRQPMSDAQRSMLITEASECMRVPSKRVIISAEKLSIRPMVRADNINMTRMMVKIMTGTIKGAVEKKRLQMATGENAARVAINGFVNLQWFLK